MAKAKDTTVVLVLQGGGALGAYHVGAYRAMHEAGFAPDWVSGISIGAFTAAVVVGTPPEKRVERLEEFWEEISRPGRKRRREAGHTARPRSRLGQQRGGRQAGPLHLGAHRIECDDLVAIVATAILHRQQRQHVAGVFFGRDPRPEAPAEPPAEGAMPAQHLAEPFAIGVAASPIEIEQRRQQRPVCLELRRFQRLLLPPHLVLARPQIGEQLRAGSR